MRGSVGQVALLGMVFLLGLSFLAAGQSPLGLTPTPVEPPLAVQLWLGRTAYTEGDAASVQFTVNRSAYVYLFEVLVDGRVRMLFPNGYSAGNYVSPGTHSLPEGLYQFPIEGPGGTGHMQIVASLAPLGLPAPSPSDPYPLVGSDPNAAVAAIQAQIDALPESDACGPQWVTAWCSFSVAAKPQATSCACPTPVPTPVTNYCPAPTVSYCPPASPTPPLAYPPTVGYYCPPASPTPPLPSPPISYCPPTYPTPPLPQPPVCYNPCPPVQNPCPPVYNPCGLLFGFFFGFQIHCGTP